MLDTEKDYITAMAGVFTIAGTIAMSQDITANQANILSDCFIVITAWVAAIWALNCRKPTLTKYYLCYAAIMVTTCILCLIYVNVFNMSDSLKLASVKLAQTALGAALAGIAIIAVRLFQRRKLNRTNKSNK